MIKVLNNGLPKGIFEIITCFPEDAKSSNQIIIIVWNMKASIRYILRYLHEVNYIMREMPENRTIKELY